MGTLTLYILVAVGVFLSSCSQILLKKSAQVGHSSMIAEMLNKRVILINIIALAHGVKVKDLPILEALGYIFVPLLYLAFFEGEVIQANFSCNISFVE